MAQRERVLITGGSGFIGACLARDLVAAGHDVHLILRSESNTWRLTGITGQYTPHWADLRDAEAVGKAVRSSRPEVIYHLATHGAYHFQKDRAAILTTNLLGTANLLDALEACDYQALVNAGSSSEYGHRNGPMRETDRLKPRTDYAVTKAAATLLCQAEAYKGRPVCTVRVFSAYGPWEDPSRLVPYVMDCCLRGETPRVTAGRQPRDFIYVADVVELLKLAAHQVAEVATTSSTRGEILHAGTGQQHNVRDMVETIVSVCVGRIDNPSYSSRGPVTPEFGAESERPASRRPGLQVSSTRPLSQVGDPATTCAGVERVWNWYVDTASRKAA